MATPVGVEPTGTVAITARFTRSMTESVLSDRLAMTSVSPLGVSAYAPGATPSLIGVPGLCVATSTGISTPGWLLVPASVIQTVVPSLL